VLTAGDRRYEVNISNLSLTPRPLQRFLLPGAYASRAKLQEVMGAYYTAELDSHESAAQLTRGRANACRAWDLTGREIGQCESFFPIVGATNSAPMTYWLMNFVYGTPGLVPRLREEVAAIVKRETSDGEDVATVDVSRLEKECPLLVSCYRETLRKTNASVSVRRIMEDTTISDGKGHSYLLKKGVDVQLPAGVAHNLANVWGQNVNDFYPDRFLESRTSTTTGEAGKQERRNAMIPFGGGKHLCPGRNFAIAEILGFTATLLAGFEVEAIGTTPFGKMQPAIAKLATAMLRPVGDGKGQGVRISRREGWEKTQWRYVS
jgi:cytochrome P450